MEGVFWFVMIFTPLTWYCLFQTNKMKEDAVNRQRVVRLLPKGTRVRIPACHCQNSRSIGQIGIVNGYSFGGTAVNVVFNIGKADCYEELISMEKALDIIEVVPHEVD